MKKASLALAMLVAMVMAFGLPGTVMAKSNPQLDPPTGLVCDFNATPSTDWDDLLGATKYSVELIAGYDTDGDDEVDTTRTVSFGTGKSGLSELNIPFSALLFDFGSGPIAPLEVDAQVKGLNPPGKSQNNPFGDLVSCTLPD